MVKACSAIFTAVLTVVALHTAAAAANINKSTVPNGTHTTPRPDVAGLVLEMHGNWQTTTALKTASIKQGDAIINGSLIKPKSADASITVVLTDGSKLKCPGCSACEKPIVVPRTESATNRWLSAALGLFAQKPSTWLVTESRHSDLACQQPEIRDAVVDTDTSGRVDLTPAILSAPGIYTVRITRPTAQSHDLVTEMRLDLSKTSQPLLNVPGITPGLYRIELISNPEEPGQEAWILVCDHNTFRSKELAFAQATADAKEWSVGEEAPRQVRALLRAYLASLVD